MIKIRCVWEHNGNDSIIYSDNYIGAFTRGATKETALNKMQHEVECYLKWMDKDAVPPVSVEIVQEKESCLQICDADSDVIFEKERFPLTQDEYIYLRQLALKSASDFLILYDSVPDKNKSVLSERITFYGNVPITAKEMYEHTKNVNEYYFSEIGVAVNNNGSIYECRKRGFQLLEQLPNFLNNKVYLGSCNEEWSLRKVIRRFIWHDRIHAKAMYKMAIKTFGRNVVSNIYCFDE